MDGEAEEIGQYFDSSPPPDREAEWRRAQYMQMQLQTRALERITQALYFIAAALVIGIWKVWG